IARRGARGAASCREKDPPLRARGLHAAAQPGTRTKPQRPENACLIRDRRRLAVTSAHAGARRALLRCAERKTGACPPVRWHRGYTSRLPLERSPPRTDWLVTMMRKPQVVVGVAMLATASLTWLGGTNHIHPSPLAALGREPL